MTTPESMMLVDRLHAVEPASSYTIDDYLGYAYEVDYPAGSPGTRVVKTVMFCRLSPGEYRFVGLDGIKIRSDMKDVNIIRKVSDCVNAN